MANVIDTALKDIRELISNTRKESGGLNNEQSLEILCIRLKESEGYFQWSPLGEDNLRVWMIRTPRTDVEEEPWVQEEGPRLVHICNPLKFINGIENADREATAAVSGHVKDANDEVSDPSSMKCVVCNKSMPKDIAKKSIVQYKFYKIQSNMEK